MKKKKYIYMPCLFNFGYLFFQITIKLQDWTFTPQLELYYIIIFFVCLLVFIYFFFCQFEMFIDVGSKNQLRKHFLIIYFSDSIQICHM